MDVKKLIQSLIAEEMKKLQEATTEEIGHLQDVLEMPKSALPFQDIFGDRYRILSSFKSDDPNSPFAQFENFLNRTGWRFNPDNMGEVLKSVTTYYIANPEDGVQQRTQEEKMSLTKWMQDLQNYLNSFSVLLKDFYVNMNDMAEYVNINFKSETEKKPTPSWQRDRNKYGGYKPEYLKDKNYLNMFRKRLSLRKAIEKFIPKENEMSVYAGIVRVNWESEDLKKEVDAYYNLNSLARTAQKQQEWLMGSKGSGQKNYELLNGKGYDEFKSSMGEKEYVVFSRHPIDVFRMSDHEGLDSCHSLPSGKNSKIYDAFNICALAEAHANGMIAYAINPDEVGEFTQEVLDGYENKELFNDLERGVDGISPVARVRIKNVAFLENEKDLTKIVSRIAVPEKRVYGDNIPGFLEHVKKVLSNSQKSKIEDIVSQFKDNKMSLNRFLRVGGSYEDNSMSSMIPEFFGQVLDRKDLEFTSSVRYSSDLEQSLKEQYKKFSIDDATKKLEELKNEYSGGRVDFYHLNVEEINDGGMSGLEGFFMTGEVTIVIPFGNEIQYIKLDTDVSSIMENAINSAEEMYFYDQSWFKDYVVYFRHSAFGYKNVCIVEFSIQNYDNGENDQYLSVDSDTWMYALNDIADVVNKITDPMHADNLQNYLKEYATYHSKGAIRTDVSEKFYMTVFKDALEEDTNWNINDLEVDEDNTIGIEVVESFIAQYEGGIWLGDLFASINENFNPENPELVEMAKRFSGHLSTLLSILSSEGMNILKAGLLDNKIYHNKDLYSGLSGGTKLNELQMTIESTVAGQAEISPDIIFQAIIDNEELQLDIKILCKDWDAATIETVGNMMLGKFNRNNGWHIDAEKSAEALVNADVKNLSEQKKSKNLKDMIREEVLRLLKK